MQPQDEARGGNHRRKRHEHPCELWKVCACLPRERHRVQGMSGGEAVAIKRSCGTIDSARVMIGRSAGGSTARAGPGLTGGTRRCCAGKAGDNPSAARMGWAAP